ncbi:hypothetical protein ACVME8_009636 [Bradyrhizobium diazoefficiens]
MLAATFGDLPSVDASGQLDVRDEKVDNPPPAPRQRLLAIGCMDDVYPSSRRVSTTNSRMRGSSSTRSIRTADPQIPGQSASADG